MASVLEQLDNSSLLLLYLADELSGDDRATVERRLASEPALDEALQQLRAAHHASELAFTQADTGTRLPMHQETAVRRISRAMKQWQVDRLTQTPAGIRARRYFRVPWWGYAFAAVVAVIVSVVMWSSNLPDANTPNTDQQVADALLDSFGPVDEAALDDTHDQIATLRSPSNDMNSVFMRIGERQ